MVQTILWTKSKNLNMPWEYIELILMRDVYHCTREELYRQDIDGVIMDLELLGVEAKVEEFRQQKGSKK